jgi:hypothetical protein
MLHDPTLCIVDAAFVTHLSKERHEGDKSVYCAQLDCLCIDNCRVPCNLPCTFDEVSYVLYNTGRESLQDSRLCPSSGSFPFSPWPPSTLMKELLPEPVAPMRANIESAELVRGGVGEDVVDRKRPKSTAHTATSTPTATMQLYLRGLVVPSFVFGPLSSNLSAAATVPYVC